MFKSKLTALEYHTIDGFNAEDDKQFRALVIWLEEQKIRHHKVEDRDPLRDLESDNWPIVFNNYCADLSCPITSGKKSERLEWLLSHAVRLEYNDNIDKFSTQTSTEVLKNRQNTPKVVSSNPLDNLDFESEDFKKGVNSLAKLLQITPHPNHLITLRAISKLINQRLTAEAIQNVDSVVPKGKAYPFDTVDDGFEKGNKAVNSASKMLRLLYLHDLRSLQTKINESIVAVQNLTANPKTDTSLGKVGR
ncbi:RNA transcription, translation and transport factor protein [Nilaparvata lugens]|uniref:RNA transcription, translation and transport factor protein n=1 Tax=Nilaparvata lugens TaxID=108931 RepID=UPI00193D5313|nr:RNA transcription, translation and transport factor protein [Nilaparvata lugens]